MSALSDRLLRAKGALSIDDLVARAEERGHRIDRSVVARYLKGEHGPRPRQETLSALAAGFDVDARELRSLAGRPPGELGPYVPTSESVSLTAEQRQALDQLIRAITRGAAGGSGAIRALAPEPEPGTAEQSGGAPASVESGLIDAQRRVASRRSVRPGTEETDEE